jgi:hypothetical protein
MTIRIKAVHVLLSRFYPDFVQILFRFYPNNLETQFILFLSRFYSIFWKKKSR